MPNPDEDQEILPMTDPETGLPFGVGEDTGLPTTVGTGNLVDAATAGSDQVGEAGTAGDPAYDPNVSDEDFIHFLHGRVAEPDWGTPGEIDMNPAPEDNTRTAFNIKEGQRASAGFRGVTDEGIKQSDKLFDPARQRAGKKSDALADQYGADVKRLQAQTEMKRALLDDYAAKEREHFDNVADIRRQQLELNIKAKQAEEIATQRARANADQYIAHYNDEMSGVRQLMMQTGNPLGGLTAVQGGGMGAALFAQGFLGARYGIKIDVGGQIDRWVTQEMNAHQNKIANLSNAAQGQLKLYDIARQQGLDDQLTRDRLKGFAIDAMKANLYMESARYQSATAQNDARVKAAELDALQLANEMKMRDNLIKQQTDIAKDEIDAAYKQGLISMQQRNAEIDAYRAANQAKHEAWQRGRQDKLDDAALNAPPPDNNWMQIVDPGKPDVDAEGNITGYKTTWTIDPSFAANAPKEVLNATIKDIEEKSASYIGGIKGLDNVRTYLEAHPDAYKRALKVGGGFTDNAENREYARRFNAAVMEFRHSMFAGNLTENEQKLVDQFNGEDFIFQRGTNGPTALDDLENMMRHRFEASIESKQGVRVNPVPGTRRIDSLMNRTKARSAANDAPEAELTPGQEKAGRVTGVDRNRPIGGNFSMTTDEEGRPSIKADRTLSDRSLQALGRQVVVGMDHYDEVVERGMTGKAMVKDGLTMLQELRDKGDKDAAVVLERLYKTYPKLKE